METYVDPTDFDGNSDAELTTHPDWNNGQPFTIRGNYATLKPFAEAAGVPDYTPLGTVAIQSAEQDPSPYRSRPAALVGRLATWLDGR